MRALLIIVLLMSRPALAYEVLSMDVKHQDGQYMVNLEILVDVPVEFAEWALLDFERLDELNRSIQKIAVLERPGPDTYRVRSELRTCAWFRCVEMQRVEEVKRLRSGLIEATTLPEDSDFHMGISQWTLHDRGDQTLIEYRSAFEPSKNAVPVLGPVLAKKVIKREALMTYRNMEARYLQQEQPCVAC